MKHLRSIKISKESFDSIGKDLCLIFFRLFSACNKLQSNHSLYVLNMNHKLDNSISFMRNQVFLLFRLISDIYELEHSWRAINNYLFIHKEQLPLSNKFYLDADLDECIKKISTNSIFNKIRNQLGSHDCDNNKYYDVWYDNLLPNNNITIVSMDGITEDDVLFGSWDIILNGMRVCDELKSEGFLNDLLFISITGVDHIKQLFINVCYDKQISLLE